jgi:glycosyltransferase involved in cell wall biosynthesis
MKIGFDGKRATNNLTGLGNYSRSLIAQLARFFPQNQYFVYTPGIKDKDQVSRFLAIENIQTRIPLAPSLLWRSLGIKKQLLADQVDLFHGLSHEIPLGLQDINIPSVVTVHDLIFLRFPKYFKRIDRFFYKLKCRYACRHADKVIAISESTKRDIMEFFGTDPSKIEVVYQSCDDSFKVPAEQQKKEEVRKNFRLPNQYILSVGTIETRKNLLSLVRAMPHIDESYPLVVVGRQTAYYHLVLNEVKALGLEQRVIFLENVPFDALPAIYQLAAVFVYPSRYEGFGIPIIEALYAGIPVVASTGSCLEEAGGPSGSYVAPDDHPGFATAVNHLLRLSEPERSERIAAGLAYVQRFDNLRLSNELMEVYHKVLSSYSKDRYVKN